VPRLLRVCRIAPSKPINALYLYFVAKKESYRFQ
jgi:hypothetical protein